MADIAIIIGNGFDLDLGLPSRYSDFIESPEWKELARTLSNYPYEDYLNHSLINHLKKVWEKENWFDIEEAIHQFVMEHKECSKEEIRDIKSEFNRLKKALTNYLKRVSESFKADESKMACQFLYNLVQCPHRMSEIYFNYTYPRLFLNGRTFYKPGYCTFTYVHGNLRDNDIVLGCDLQEGEKVNRDLSFMYKYNMLNKANHVARSILEAKEIIFFGHSLNEMDFRYFKEFFKVASKAPEPTKHLTIITYDEESERNIKDNIQNQGISVTDLYSNLLSFDFIHTSKFYKGDKNEQELWKGMMLRLLS